MERVPYGTPLQNSIITRREKFLETLIFTLTPIHDIINMPIIKYSNFIDFWVGCHKKLLPNWKINWLIDCCLSSIQGQGR
jgi:hypothetical protein